MVPLTEIHIHDAKPHVDSRDSTLWLKVPLSTDGTAEVTMFLEPAVALQIAADLTRRATAIQQAQIALRAADEVPA